MDYKEWLETHFFEQDRRMVTPEMAWEACKKLGVNAKLESAASAVVREALDNVEVHPCDVHNDEVRGSKLYGPIRELYEALK